MGAPAFDKNYEIPGPTTARDREVDPDVVFAALMRGVISNKSQQNDSNIRNRFAEEYLEQFKDSEVEQTERADLTQRQATILAVQNGYADRMASLPNSAYRTSEGNNIRLAIESRHGTTWSLEMTNWLERKTNNIGERHECLSLAERCHFDTMPRAEYKD